MTVEKIGHFDRNIALYYLLSFFEGLRFLMPIWLIWYTRFIPMATVGLIEGIGIIIGMILEVPTGAFADAVGRKTSIIIGKIGISIAAFLIALTTGSTQLIVGIILWNVAGAFVSGADTALIYDYLLSTNRESLFTKINSKATVIMRLGVIIGSFTGGYIFNLWAPLPYFLFGVSGIIEIFIWFFIKEPKIDTIHFSWSGYKETVSSGFKAISHSSRIRLISIVSIITIAFAAIFREELNYSFAIDLGLNATNQSLLFGVSGIIKMMAVIIIGHMIVRFSQNKVAYSYLLSFGVILLVAIISGSVGGIVIILLVEMMSAMAPIISDTYLNRELNSAERATAISFVNMFSSLTKAIGLFLGMYFIGLVKSPTVFTTFGLVLLIITTWLIFLQKNEKRN